MAEMKKRKMNPWRDAPGIGPPKPTRYLKEDFGPEWGSDTIFTAHGLKARVNRMLNGPSPEQSRVSAERDEVEGRVTDVPKKKRVKDQSRLMPDSGSIEYGTKRKRRADNY